MNLEVSIPDKPKGGIVSGFFQVLVLLVFLAAGWFLHGLLFGGGAAGGGMPGGQGGAGGPVQVETVLVKEGASYDIQEYVGRVESVQTVDITSQITGYITQVHFTEGCIVQEGDLLFTIEQEPYQARVSLAQASLEQAKANLAGAQADLNSTQASLESAKADADRAEKYLKRLRNADKRSIVEADLDKAISEDLQAKAKVQETEANLKVANATILQMEAQVQKSKADLELAQIDLGYTEIRSPITGQIGKAVMTKGNYVSPSSGALAHVVQLDPIRVVFAMSDREYVSVLQKTRENAALPYTTHLRLPNGTSYESIGEQDFNDNEMDSQTGTISVYSRFDNRDGFLIPRSYVTVSLQYDQTKTVPTVPQQSIFAEGEGDYVYVVDESGTVEKRKVELGRKIDSYQCIASGLRVGERVISQGLQKVQQGQNVTFSSPSEKGDA